MKMKYLTDNKHFLQVNKHKSTSTGLKYIIDDKYLLTKGLL